MTLNSVGKSESPGVSLLILGLLLSSVDIALRFILTWILSTFQISHVVFTYFEDILTWVLLFFQIAHVVFTRISSKITWFLLWTNFHHVIDHFLSKYYVNNAKHPKYSRKTQPGSGQLLCHHRQQQGDLPLSLFSFRLTRFLRVNYDDSCNY